MSSSVEKLFGNVAADDIESNVSKLFGSSTGPIDGKKVKAKSRTILPELPQKSENQTLDESLSEEEENSQESDVAETSQESKEEEASQESEVEQVSQQSEELATPENLTKKRKTDNDDQLEDKYFAKLMDQDIAEEKEATEVAKDHTQAGSTAKKIDLKENELEKAERTVFVGNVPSDVIINKSLYKQFKRLFQNDSSGVESIRFRSISFDEALPRKVAFVQQKLHKSRGSVNAYVVYKEKSAVTPACHHLNGEVFADRHLRVDSVSHPAHHDNKRSVFVGNLDFEEDEESLWRHFCSCGEIEYVRVVREPKTNMGKGFAYIQFKDFPSVSKALLLNDRALESRGKSRKLRVTRCKNMRKSGNVIQSLKGKGINKLSDAHKTRLGRAKKILNKADAAQLGQQITVEGLRATKADSKPSSVLKKRKNRSKTGRVTKRSQAHKKNQNTK
ncbi:related to Nucleolar protein 12 [Zygosaccharomyces bailii]|nr:related to Nucleolar protein 12 [Zygosaccharomyces bailii]